MTDDAPDRIRLADRVHDRRLAAALVLGGWALIVVYFRFEMLLVIPWPLAPWQSASILLRDVALLAALGAIFFLAARARTRVGGWCFWLLLVAFGVLIQAFSLFEHTYFTLTGSRLRRSLAVYSFLEFDQLKLVIASGLDSAFRRRLALVAACTLAPWVLWWRLRRLRWRCPPWALPALLGLAVLTTLLPVARPLVQEGLETPAVVEFLAPEPDLDALLRPADDATDALADADQEPIYRVPEAVSEPVRRPNIVLLILESTGADIAAPWNPESAATPFLRRLAQESWVVENTYVTVSHTSKALIGILCGAWPHPELFLEEMGRESGEESNWPLDCLPELLRREGYRTAFVQSASKHFEGRPALLRRLGYQHAAYSEEIASEQFPALGYLSIDDRSLLAPAAEVAAGPQPVFLTLLTSATHHPYALPGLPWPEKSESHLYHRAAVERQDDVSRLLFQMLGDSPLAGPTTDGLLFVVIGDHGEAFGQHLLMHHNSVPYEEVMRVPWLLWGPGLLGEPRRIGGLRHQLDLVPTVLDLLGMEHDGRLPGRSLLGPPHDEVASFCWGADTCASLRQGDLKTVYFYGTRPTQYFDLAADPGELDEASARLDDRRREQMLDRLLDLRRRIGDFWSSLEETPDPDPPREPAEDPPQERGV